MLSKKLMRKARMRRRWKFQADRPCIALQLARPLLCLQQSCSWSLLLQLGILLYTLLWSLLCNSWDAFTFVLLQYCFSATSLDYSVATLVLTLYYCSIAELLCCHADTFNFVLLCFPLCNAASSIPTLQLLNYLLLPCYFYSHNTVLLLLIF